MVVAVASLARPEIDYILRCIQIQNGTFLLQLLAVYFASNLMQNRALALIIV